MKVNVIPRLLPVMLASLLLSAGLNAASALTGNWRTIDDASGKTKSIVEIYGTGDGTLNGRIVQILHSERGPNPLCDKCPGERQGQPIEGMVILWDMEPVSSEEARHGRILDPQNGRIYKARLKLRDDGNLEVRGFIGIALIGRTQIWQPAPEIP
jgi:uncharacterized protein (DUF2147 family)